MTFDATEDKLLATPWLFRAAMAKYQVPVDRFSIMYVVSPGVSSLTRRSSELALRP
jgi:hypothetical protein